MPKTWQHSKQSPHERGYGWAWQKLRKTILERDSYLCQHCLSQDIATTANQVDHIIPKAKGGTDDHDNLQALCKPCHDAKTIIDNGGNRLQRVGLDGWTVE